MRYPSSQALDDACLSARHDFGLMGPVEKANLQGNAMMWYRAWHGALGIDIDKMACLINDISEAVVGHREAEESEIIDTAIRLKAIAAQHQHGEQIQSVIDAVRDLSALVDDIESDA